MSTHFNDLSPSLRVLVAEDDNELRALVASAVRADGHEVVEARDGRELAAHMGPGPHGAQAYDLVITDVLMPGANGISVLSHLASDPEPPHIVVITAFGEPEVHAWARSIGAVAVFDKPFNLDDLRTLIWNLPPRALHGA
jgi:CheY-like chemotaxis protein